MVSALDSAFTSATFSDEETAAFFSDRAEITALIKFERTLAHVQESLGIIPAGTGKMISSDLDNFEVEPARLAAGYTKDGIVVPTLLKLLRQKLRNESANYIHYGATSQDALDTALIIRIKSAISIIEQNLDCLITELVSFAIAHKSTVMIGRTRNQNSAPTLFALKVVNWLMPMRRQRKRLTELIPRLLVLQLSGSVGTNAALRGRGKEVYDALAKSLELSSSDSPWHAQRDSIVEFANWLSLTAGQLGKMGKDLLLMAQNEVGEISISNPGKSSTMPNKANPVSSETLISLAAFCRSNADLINQTALASHERDGVSMAIERLALPSLICAASGSIVRAKDCLKNISVNTGAMQKNLVADRGLIMAEAAVFALMDCTSREIATELVSQACELSTSNNSHMIDELKALSSFDLDWEGMKSPESYLGDAADIIDKVVSEIKN